MGGYACNLLYVCLAPGSSRGGGNASPCSSLSGAEQGTVRLLPQRRGACFDSLRRHRGCVQFAGHNSRLAGLSGLEQIPSPKRNGPLMGQPMRL